MESDSLLSGENAAFLDAKYAAWLIDRSSVEPEWAALFESWGDPDPLAPVNGSTRPGAEPRFPHRSIFHGQVGGGVDLADEHEVIRSDAAAKQAKVAQLINAYRVRGHLKAKVDPLGERERVKHPEMTLEYYGLSEADLDTKFATAPLYHMPEFAPLRDILKRCKDAYSDQISCEFMNIDVVEQKQWLAERIERLPGVDVLDRDDEKHFLRKLADAENFERTLHQKFPGTKRFSLEGGETLVPLLDMAVQKAGQFGVREVVFGMAHRGRLSVLCNILEKPVGVIVAEFEDTLADQVEGSGDVKYHLGYSSDTITRDGHQVHVSLTPNPSHLEAVNGVLAGRVRAKQDRDLEDGKSADQGEAERKCLPLLIHGDAAFAGQGVVAEHLQMSELRGYRNGGTIHVIVNNQIGFTTGPGDARSTPYATGIARMLGVPIFHVNGESPRAVAAATAIAVEWRQKFGRDVVIDMYCYRKWGHNEGDEPSFTQPQMYALIRKRPTPFEAYADFLTTRGYITPDEVQAIEQQSKEAFDAALEAPESHPAGGPHVADDHKSPDPDADRYRKRGESPTVAAMKEHIEVQSPFKGLWSRFRGHIRDEADTAVDLDHLLGLLRRANTLPEGFSAHNKIKRLLKQRMDMIDGQRPVDWALAEQAAFATAVTEGYRVRLVGQDAGRGTFSHRHAVLTDVKTGAEIQPLDQLTADQRRFEVFDSLLSEEAALAYEIGYAMDCPDGLCLWEAQFGDFANGAQIPIDQYLVSAEQKWQRSLGLVLLLPHGMEGQGPEHSSARLERFLQACADDNIQVANVTLPANFFHLLRRQTVRRVRKPLVVMSPKSGLRHPMAISTLDELAKGRFQHVIRDPNGAADGAAKRLVFCSGKVFFDLEADRRSMTSDDSSYGVDGLQVHRVEMLYPFPHEPIGALLEANPDAEVVWCQEEPKNMGAWWYVLQMFVDHFPDRLPRYIGREPAAAPAGGSHKIDRAHQADVVRRALTLDC